MERDQAANGVSKCANCGSSDIRFDGAWLTCAHCRHRWNTAVLAEQLNLSEGIENLVGTSVLTGAKDIDTSSLVTVTCGACGASVTINSETSLQTTCHWCRHVLSLNNPVDNGAIPDAILPFFVTREDALTRMKQYVSQHSSFASAAYKADFEKTTIRAVYLPYLVVDGTATITLEGTGWVQDLGWIGGTSTDLVYRTEEFAVMREADLLIDDLVIEARSTHTPLNAAVSTTNIINAIQPFDVEQAVRFDARYLTDGVAFEKRDVDVSDATAYAVNLFATIVRGYVNQTLDAYTGGVRWESEQTAIKGTRWVSMLLPVWLYAFEERTPSGPMMHYIAVNGRTGDTEGSVPTDEAIVRRSVRKWGWGAAAVFLAVFGSPFALFVPFLVAAMIGGDMPLYTGAFIAPFVLVYGAMAQAVYRRVAKWRLGIIGQGQRNPDARLKPEVETKYTLTRLDQGDDFLGRFEHKGGPEIDGRNDHRPQDRAVRSPIVLGDASPPRAGGHATADLEWEAPRVNGVDGDRNRVAGQQPSAPAPGVVPVPIAQLISGWRKGARDGAR